MINRSRRFGLPLFLCAALENPGVADADRGRIHRGTGISYEKVDTHEAFDLKTNTWETLASLPQAVAGIAAASFDGKLYVFGGEDDISPYEVYDFAWRYDLLTNSWSDIAPLPIPLHGHGAVATKKGVHILGRSTKPGGTGTVISHFMPTITK